MDRETLWEAVKEGPIRVTMNDGQTYDIPSPEFVTVGDIAAYVLVRSPDGKLRAKRLALVCMTTIEEMIA
jgi:hypothetical protein